MSETVIDLRSDTLSKPTPGMRAAMVEAEVGDDVYADDPTVNAFERDLAARFGHQAGLFCATGSLANLLGVRALVEPGQEIVCDVDAHLVRAELGAHAALSGITTRTFRSDRGQLDPDEVMAMVAPAAGPYLVSTAAIAVENTHNFGGGTIQPFDRLETLVALAAERGLTVHLDGARLWNAHVVTGVSLAAYGRLFDTVSVCFSKGLGAPIGSMLLADADRIAQARVLRKRLGAGWRQAGMLAAAARYAVDHQLLRLADDHLAAAAFAEAVAERAPHAVELGRVQTNIVVLDTGPLAAARVAAAAAERGVIVSALGARMLRAVTQLGVDRDDCTAAGRVIGELLAG